MKPIVTRQLLALITFVVVAAASVAPADEPPTPAELRQALIDLLKRPEMAEAVRAMPSPAATTRPTTRPATRSTSRPSDGPKDPESLADAMATAMPSLLADGSEHPSVPKEVPGDFPENTEQRIKALEAIVADFKVARWPVEEAMSRLHRAGKLTTVERELYMRTLAARVDQLAKYIE